MAQTVVSLWMFDIEVSSGAHLAGVTRLRLDDDTAFINSTLAQPLDDGGDDQADSWAAIDWVGTFSLKSDDILVTLDSIEQNVCIRRYYSVWAADVEFNKHHLKLLAQNVLKASDTATRQRNLETYLEHLRSTSQQLGRLASEMRS